MPPWRLQSGLSWWSSHSVARLLQEDGQQKPPGRGCCSEGLPTAFSTMLAVHLYSVDSMTSAVWQCGLS